VKTNRIVILLVMCLFAKSVFALECKLSEYDFGIIKEGDKVRHNFKIQNNTNKEVVIKRIIAECSCVSSTKKTISLNPGEMTLVDITFNSTGYGGRKIQKDIVLIDEAGFQLNLTIKGTVKGIPPGERLNIMPLEISMFNDFAEEREIIIEAPAEKDLKIEFESPTWMTCKLKKLERKHSKVFQAYILECSLNELQNDRTSEDMYIITNLRHFEKIPIRVHVEPKPTVIVSPPVLFIKNRKLGETYSKEFEIDLVTDLFSKNTRENNVNDSQRIARDKSSHKNPRLNSSSTGILPFVIEPSNNCLTLKLLSISHDSKKIKYAVTLRDCPSTSLRLKVIAHNKCVGEIPVIISTTGKRGSAGKRGSGTFSDTTTK